MHRKRPHVKAGLGIGMIEKANASRDFHHSRYCWVAPKAVIRARVSPRIRSRNNRCAALSGGESSYCDLATQEEALRRLRERSSRVCRYAIRHAADWNNGKGLACQTTFIPMSFIAANPHTKICALLGFAKVYSSI